MNATIILILSLLFNSVNTQRQAFTLLEKDGMYTLLFSQETYNSPRKEIELYDDTFILQDKRVLSQMEPMVQFDLRTSNLDIYWVVLHCDDTSYLKCLPAQME